jgi:hypothetical protein
MAAPHLLQPARAFRHEHAGQLGQQLPVAHHLGQGGGHIKGLRRGNSLRGPGRRFGRGKEDKKIKKTLAMAGDASKVN